MKRGMNDENFWYAYNRLESVILKGGTVFKLTINQETNQRKASVACKKRNS